MDMNRRQFFKACAAGLGGSSLALLGFSPQEVLAETRNYKLARATETRNTCPVLLGGLRHPHVQPRRQGEERALRDHPYRG